jgi:hypothetical protein
MVQSTNPRQLDDVAHRARLDRTRLRAVVGESLVTLGIVKKSEQEFAEWLAEEWGFLCGLASFDDEPLQLEPYQIEFLQNRSRFRWVTKSRQVGFSFVFALEALARVTSGTSIALACQKERGPAPKTGTEIGGGCWVESIVAESDGKYRFSPSRTFVDEVLARVRRRIMLVFASEDFNAVGEQLHR